MSENDALRRRRRRPDWLIALGMAVGALAIAALMAWLTYPATWGALVAGVLTVPAAILGGIVVLATEADDARA